MVDTDELTDYLILRALPEPISHEELDEAADASGDALKALRDEGKGIWWYESEVLENEDGQVTGTFCHYGAESQDVVEEHAERAGLPATRIDRQGSKLAGESEE